MKDTNKSVAGALCSICGEGHVTDGMAMTEFKYKGKTTELPLRFTTCDTCGSESAGLDESRANKRVAMAFRKSVDGLLTGAEITALRKRYGLTQDQAARLFGGGPVAFSKYENDDVAQSEAMDKLLRLIRRSEAAFWELADECGMTAEFSKPKVLAWTTTTSSNVLLMENYRTDAARGPANLTLRPYEPEDKKWN